MKNVAYVWEPHNLTGTVRAACYLQREAVNYIIICCSPSRNGVWRWKLPENGEFPTVIMNGKLPCYVVNFSDMEFVQPLDSIKNPAMRKRIRKEQEDWAKRFRHKDQDWFIKL